MNTQSTPRTEVGAAQEPTSKVNERLYVLIGQLDGQNEMLRVLSKIVSKVDGLQDQFPNRNVEECAISLSAQIGNAITIIEEHNSILYSLTQRLKDEAG
jgi:hypothetical protein